MFIINVGVIPRTTPLNAIVLEVIILEFEMVILVFKHFFIPKMQCTHCTMVNSTWHNNWAEGDNNKHWPNTSFLHQLCRFYNIYRSRFLVVAGIYYLAYRRTRGCAEYTESKLDKWSLNPCFPCNTNLVRKSAQTLVVSQISVDLYVPGAA